MPRPLAAGPARFHFHSSLCRVKATWRFVPAFSRPAARMPLLHAEEVAEKVGNRLPYGRGSESARRVYSHLLSRDRQGAVVLVLFQQPLKRAPSFQPRRASRRPALPYGIRSLWLRRRASAFPPSELRRLLRPSSASALPPEVWKQPLPCLKLCLPTRAWPSFLSSTWIRIMKAFWLNCWRGQLRCRSRMLRRPPFPSPITFT